MTESEVRKHTQESIFNSVRGSLEVNELLKQPTSPWADYEWRLGEFVDFTSGRTIVPLVSMLSRVRAIAESFAFAASVLSAESLQERARRLGQGHFGVVGKVLRAPEPGTAVNVFRNSMLGATNQLPVLLTRLTSQLTRLPALLGDAVQIDEDDEGDPVYLDFVGSASAFAELNPLWLYPSVEIFPVAIYA